MKSISGEIRFNFLNKKLKILQDILVENFELFKKIPKTF